MADIADLPFLDFAQPGFSTRSCDVGAARDASWVARTPYGLAILRHREAGHVLRDRRFRQGSHAWPEILGISGEFAAFWSRSVISQEGPAHKAQRRIVQQALRPEAVDALIPAFERDAEALADSFVPQGQDVIAGFTEPYAGRAIAALLDVPRAEAGSLARDAATLGLAMGLDGLCHQAQVNSACTRLMALADRLIDRAEAGADPTGMVGRLVTAGAGLERQTLQDLIVIAIFGGVDTTRAQLGFALDLLADHPAQWTWLRAHPEAVGQAIDEVVRTRPTTTWATREAVEDMVLNGLAIEAGTTIHILVHASGTDPALGAWSGFDIRSKRGVHFGFGGGAHHCLGHYVARTDMAAALRVLARRFARITRSGTARYLPDTGNTGPSVLPLAFAPA